VTFPCNFVHNATAQTYLVNAAVANPVTMEWFKIVGRITAIPFPRLSFFQDELRHNGAEESDSRCALAERLKLYWRLLRYPHPHRELGEP